MKYMVVAKDGASGQVFTYRAECLAEVLVLEKRGDTVLSVTFVD